MRSAFSAYLLCLTTTLLGCGVESESSDEQDFIQAKPLGPTPQGAPTQFPIVLMHGFNASTEFWGFYRVADALRADGHVVFETTVPPYNSTEVRAGVLAKQIDDILAQRFGKVNLLAHSMGGLDGRALISSLDYGDRIASLTTMATPHRGAPVADKLLAITDGLGVDDGTLDDFATMLGGHFSELADEASLRAAFKSLSVAHAPTFDADNPDDPRVFYHSWTGVSSVAGIKNLRDRSACEGMMLGDGKVADKMDPLVVPIAAVTHGGVFEPNDGLVTVQSAKFGQFRGCVPADHLDEVGALKDEKADRRTGFDHIRFYRNLAYELAASGF